MFKCTNCNNDCDLLVHKWGCEDVRKFKAVDMVCDNCFMNWHVTISMYFALERYSNLWINK